MIDQHRETPTDERPAVILRRAIADPRRRALVALMASATEGPEHRSGDGTVWTLAAVAALVALRAAGAF